MIEVTPKIENITITANVTRQVGLEDTVVSLGTISVDGNSDIDGSEKYFLEFKLDELPKGLIIRIDGKNYP